MLTKSFQLDAKQCGNTIGEKGQGTAYSVC